MRDGRAPFFAHGTEQKDAIHGSPLPDFRIADPKIPPLCRNRVAIHARNCQQIYGEDLETPVDFVLFWAPEEDGTVEGGTATAVFLAREMKIPTFNLWEERTRERWEGLGISVLLRWKRKGSCGLFW